VTNLWSQSSEILEWEGKNSSEMDRLNYRIEQFLCASVTRDEQNNRKLKMLSHLRGLLSKVMEETKSTLDLTGSSFCNLSALNSNLDVFIESSKGRVDQELFINALKKEGVIIRKFSGVGSFHTEITNEITDGRSMDVSFHVNPPTRYMSSVYRMADNQDERVAALAMTLKAWRILDASCITAKLKSYHLMIMLIHFLQCGVSPPVLPSLSLHYPILHPTSYRLHINDVVHPVPCENLQSNASLLIGFFTYFSQFEFDEYVISIREGCLYKRNLMVDRENKRMLIEHPFYAFQSKPNDVVSPVDFAPVRAACKRALTSLTTTFNLPSVPNL
ncbi:hypothetical protein PFISCL1PPCAC_1937, partial [Pristionchus fissidentatus]